MTTIVSATRVSNEEILTALEYGKDSLTEDEFIFLIKCRDSLEKRKEIGRECAKRHYKKRMSDDDYRAKNNEKSRLYYAKNKEKIKKQRALRALADVV